MSQRRHTAEQIIPKLRQAEVFLAQGVTVGEVCKKLEITEQTYYRWRKEYGSLRIDQARRLSDAATPASISASSEYFLRSSISKLAGSAGR
jgi:transposase-like protein